MKCRVCGKELVCAECGTPKTPKRVRRNLYITEEADKALIEFSEKFNIPVNEFIAGAIEHCFVENLECVIDYKRTRR